MRGHSNDPAAIPPVIPGAVPSLPAGRAHSALQYRTGALQGASVVQKRLALVKQRTRLAGHPSDTEEQDELYLLAEQALRQVILVFCCRSLLSPLICDLQQHSRTGALQSAYVA